ncbi:hypothetical protein COCC4DRAFT_192680 [Bipolaris maydis ATCC 48331]|uniref:Glycine zipper 2TM domain-containing protein n=2 Tax=Cochliobolus heterostrophus TaxID=5016 RepID=M2TLT9_COCH5|nr:uncharacterized protein COCC4DRAFT_192680 [Bipolaris maydis ATCC 48331]EMD87474.1 hypothetical protein COCHEDRAFT_1184546 [Bipolaris maydis C5]ENI06673.1 hypothetical protein COCC4DRAFT_192680 [Bipolaris maydis ATCC 48331]KAJ6212122.1 hypothetical protein PSV09DRAFT_1184546 [Bipolaris maydis]
MAAHDYYLGTQGVHELLGTSPYMNTPPPSYSAHPYLPPPPPPKQHNGYTPHQPYPEKPSQQQAMMAPYPQTPPPGGYFASPPSIPQPQPQLQRQHSSYLGAPLQPYRSHSQPARPPSPPPPSSPLHNRDRDRDRSSSRHHNHNHSRRHKPSKSHSYDKSHDESHKTRDTFLGAGAGTLIGDAIFPGLGTAAGLVLGGYGGRKYALEKRRGDEASDGEKGGRRKKKGQDGWDERCRMGRKRSAAR